jgi:His-Xaa-Ser system protein HxsD
MNSRERENSVTFTFPIEFTSADALQRALYRVAEDGTWDVSKDEINWSVVICAKPGADLGELESRFKQHVVDYGLREKIRAETEQVRALLLAHAFSAVIPKTFR